MDTKEIKIKLKKSAFYREEEVRRKLSEFVLKTDFFSMGQECKKFEKRFSEYQGRKYAVLTNSGSSANLLLLQSLINLGILNRGDIVAFTAITWSTNVSPIIQLGLIPYPVDIELNRINSGSKQFLEAIQRSKKSDQKIKAFFITNILGICSDIDVIKDICQEHNIILIEDNCQSLGSVYKNKKLGNFGLASTFSFYIGHHLSTIEGGCVCTDDEELYNMLVISRAHGWIRNLSEQKRKEFREKYQIDSFYELYTFFDIGMNIRPTEITGFIGNIEIDFIDEIVDKRWNNFRKLIDYASNNNHLIQLDVSHMTIVSNFAFPLIFKSKEKAEEYKKKFIDYGIEIRPISGGNITKQPFFKKYLNASEFYLPNADLIHSNSFWIPNDPNLEKKEIEIMGNIISTEG